MNEPFYNYDLTSDNYDFLSYRQAGTDLPATLTMKSGELESVPIGVQKMVIED